jgi:hypothetical protein
MLANVLIESFMLMDIELGGSGKGSPNRQVKNLTNINRYMVFTGLT